MNVWSQLIEFYTPSFKSFFHCHKEVIFVSDFIICYLKKKKKKLFRLILNTFSEDAASVQAVIVFYFETLLDAK